MNTKILRTFTLLRFPLMVGVVMIHCDISDEVPPELHGQWSDYVMFLLSNVIGRLSVPMFFLISGFLFFREGTLTHIGYTTKLYSRLHTLLIPYLLWNLIGFCFFVGKHYPPLSSVFQGITQIEISPLNFLKAFWEFRFEGLGESKSMPIDFPLWYVRDLIVVVLCSPLLYRLIKGGGILVGIIGAIWFFFNPEFCGVDTTGFFFFTLGGYFAVKNINITEVVNSRNKIILILLWLVIVIVDMVSRGTTYHHLLHNITILIGISAMYICTASITNTRKDINIPACLASTTFFIYSLHGLFVAPLRKTLCLIIQPTSNVASVATYLLSVLATITLSIITYYMLKWLSPRFCSVLNGGR